MSCSSLEDEETFVFKWQFELVAKCVSQKDFKMFVVLNRTSTSLVSSVLEGFHTPLRMRRTGFLTQHLPHSEKMEPKQKQKP